MAALAAWSPVPCALPPTTPVGLIDTFRVLHPDAAVYTYWSYLRNRWPRDAGLRIVHLLLSALAAKRLAAAGVDRGVRGEAGASDHAPVWVELT